MHQEESDMSSADSAVSFEQYFTKKIVPLVEADNSVKIKQRSRFWASFWTVIFLLSINALIVLYLSLMYHKPVNYNQLIMLAIIGIAIICWPIYKYYQYKRVDIFDVFLQFYGTWHHNQNSVCPALKSVLLPLHDNMKIFHDIEGQYCGVKLRLRDVKCYKDIAIKKWHRSQGVAKGIMIDIHFNHNIAENLYLLEKKGFYHKDKMPDMFNIGARIHIPSANYFYVFNSTDTVPDRLLNAGFFEQILDIKERFAARKMYVQIYKNNVQIFLDGAELYFDNYKFWSSVIKQERFKQLHEQLEHVFTFVETIFIIEKKRQKYDAK